MFLKIVLLLVGLILLGIGVPMAEGSISERYNVYKMIVGMELAFVGLIVIAISFFSIFPQLLP